MGGTGCFWVGKVGWVGEKDFGINSGNNVVLPPPLYSTIITQQENLFHILIVKTVLRFFWLFKVQELQSTPVRILGFQAVKCCKSIYEKLSDVIIALLNSVILATYGSLQAPRYVCFGCF